MDSLFERFIRERRYLNNLCENTLYYYECAWAAYKKAVGMEINKQTLDEFVIALRERGMKASGVNAYIRGMNVFLKWLHENGGEPLKIKLLKTKQVILKPLSDDQLRLIINFKPRTNAERRLHTLLLFLADTGCRIDEALTVKKSSIDFDNLLVTLAGKGNKQRVVPFSVELRKVLYKHLSKHEFELVFCNRHGGKLLYDNMRRDFAKLMKKLNIECDGAFHAFRRTFARNIARGGGNVFYVQKFLGHSTLEMARRYVELETKDLQMAHRSLLQR